MPLPQTVPIKRTEEEAEYLSVRPVVRQSFRIDQLVDMLLAVTGKEIPRLQQILRSGTVVYHYYRYWWDGFEATGEDLRVLLANFPDPDPSREFRAEMCTAVEIESASRNAFAQHVEVDRESASRKRLFRSRSLWDGLLNPARENPPSYQAYSYARRADIYALELKPAAQEKLAREIERFAPRGLRGPLRNALRNPGALTLVYTCPR